jgi:hypothetical protein
MRSGFNEDEEDLPPWRRMMHQVLIRFLVVVEPYRVDNERLGSFLPAVADSIQTYHAQITFRFNGFEVLSFYVGVEGHARTQETRDG